MYTTFLNKISLYLLSVGCRQMLAFLLWEIGDRFCTGTGEALWNVFAAMAFGNWRPNYPRCSKQRELNKARGWV